MYKVSPLCIKYPQASVCRTASVNTRPLYKIRNQSLLQTRISMYNAPLHEVRSVADQCWLLQLYRSVPDIVSKVTGGQTYSSTVQ